MREKERWIDEFLGKKYKLGGVEISMLNMLFMLCVAVLAFLVRKSFFTISSGDFRGFLQPWMDQIRQKGGIASLKYEITNYPVAYVYILTFLSYISSNDLVAIKMVSIVFDYATAFAIFLIVLELTKSVNKSIFGAAMALVAPGVILDSALWAQCDSIYSSFVLFAIYFLLKNKGNTSGIFLGIAFCFKLQTVFILPFFIIMWLKKKGFQLYHLAWIPVMYFISILPAWIVGRSMKDLLLIYYNQSKTYPWGTLNYPNAYMFVDEYLPYYHIPELISNAGMYFAIIMVGFIAYYIYQKKAELDDNAVISLAILTLGVVVYFMPHMHDRYGFLLDLLAIVYVMLNPKKILVFIGFSVITVCTFMIFLIGVYPIPMIYMALMLGGLIFYVGFDLYKNLNTELSVKN